MPPLKLELPPLKHLALGAIPRLVETVVIPTILFLLLVHLGGPSAAFIGALAWAGLVMVTRLVLGRRVPTIVLIGIAALGFRTALALAAHSSFVYFLQPTLATATIGLCFLASAFAGRPLVLRLARDFCPIPDDVMAHGHLRRFFLGVSVLWGIVQLLNAGLTLWLLLSQSLGTFVVVRTTLVHTMTVSAIAVSVVWFRRVTRETPEPALALSA